jgi:hypothetical protein
LLTIHGAVFQLLLLTIHGAVFHCWTCSPLE